MTRKDYVVLSVASGAVALIAFVFPAQVIGDLSGLFGASPSYVLFELNLGPALAKDAQTRLPRPLTNPEAQELAAAVRECGTTLKSNCLPTVGKYALMGEVHAQIMMGILSGADASTKIGQAEAVNWYKLAFQQGGRSILQGALARSENSAEIVGDDGGRTAQTHDHVPLFGAQPGSAQIQPTTPMQLTGGTQDDSLRQALLENAMKQPAGVPTYHAYPQTSAVAPVLPDTDQSSARSAAITANGQAPHILSPAGPQNYVDQNGTVFAGAGPHGVVNTQTGEFSPTN